jgi:hypothetical protein
LHAAGQEQPAGEERVVDRHGNLEEGVTRA